MLMADARTAILTAEFVALTTYRLDGRAVTTPVWAAAEDGRLYICLLYTSPSPRDS